MPAASKKRRISGLIGAAPVTQFLMLPPNRARILESTCLSAISYCLRSSQPIGFPARSRSRTFLPTPIAQLKTSFLMPPDFSTSPVAAV